MYEYQDTILFSSYLSSTRILVLPEFLAYQRFSISNWWINKIIKFYIDSVSFLLIGPQSAHYS